jgi:hypothetical protein
MFRSAQHDNRDDEKAFRSNLMNGFGKGTALAVPLRANKNAGFSPWCPAVYSFR